MIRFNFDNNWTYSHHLPLTLTWRRRPCHSCGSDADAQQRRSEHYRLDKTPPPHLWPSGRQPHALAGLSPSSWRCDHGHLQRTQSCDPYRGGREIHVIFSFKSHEITPNIKTLNLACWKENDRFMVINAKWMAKDVLPQNPTQQITSKITVISSLWSATFLLSCDPCIL